MNPAAIVIVCVIFSASNASLAVFDTPARAFNVFFAVFCGLSAVVSSIAILAKDSK